MGTKVTKEDGKVPPAAPELTVEERRAARRAKQEAHRNRRPRHSASNPLTYEIVGAGKPCGPPGGYTITNVAEGATVEVTDARQA